MCIFVHFPGLTEYIIVGTAQRYTGEYDYIWAQLITYLWIYTDFYIPCDIPYTMDKQILRGRRIITMRRVPTVAAAVNHPYEKI